MMSETQIKDLQEKIDLLNRQAWELRVSDSPTAHLLSKEAFVKAEELGYEKGKAEGYRTYAFTLIRLSRHQEALVYAEKALALFEALNEPSGQVSIYEYYGIIQRSFGNYGASLEYLFKALELVQQTNNKESESLALYHLGVTYKYLGDFENALTYLLQSLSIARMYSVWIAESYSLNQIGLIYFETGDMDNALDYFHQSLHFRQQAGDKWGEAGCLDNIGVIHFRLQDNSKALDFCGQALSITQGISDKKGEANSLFHLGNIYEQVNDFDKAIDSYNKSLFIRRSIADKKGETEILLELAGLNLKRKRDAHAPQEIFELLNEALRLGEEIKAMDLLAKIHAGLYEACKYYKRYEEAFGHIEKHIRLAKEVHSDTVNQRIQNQDISYKAEKSKKEAEIYRLRNVELAGLYEESERQKEEIGKQKQQVEQALLNLKSAQAQLIQSEKMASLGELTAGIAHEIQNPLNFVNNFSEVSNELISEMVDEIDKGNSDEVKAIARNVQQNLEKILHHGKRADGIVKGMLQHSRSSSGVKEPTDINALADEYLRLAYHGLRAKDKSFNASLKTEYDETIGTINIIPQDIGRVILNLITNAFYAVDEKKKGQPAGYEPAVTVSTKKLNTSSGLAGVMIIVKDNGNGVPQQVIDKIFQPFFTTKPTGQGTGLGLSLSYDIVKAHGGELKVETKEGEGTSFILELPVV